MSAHGMSSGHYFSQTPCSIMWWFPGRLSWLHIAMVSHYLHVLGVSHLRSTSRNLKIPGQGSGVNTAVLTGMEQENWWLQLELRYMDSGIKSKVGIIRYCLNLI